MIITGTHINYYFTCKRKLWLFSKKITCEHQSELVKIGNIYHEDCENISIDNIKIDGFKKNKVFELKKRNSSKEASEFQVLYYLYILKKYDFYTTGLIKFKENNRIYEISLTPEKEKKLLLAIEEINKICNDKIPHPKKGRYCKKCSYYYLCYS
ncbi:MAG: CRISPR-associated protein Cas4 [Candidatus Woesearchaeota archaeon]